MSYVESYKIPLIETPSRNSSSPQASTKAKGRMIVPEEIEEMLKKKLYLQCRTNQSNMYAQF